MSAATSVGQYLENWMHVFDQVCNTAIGGDPRMTLSARMGRDIEAGRCLACKRICWVLNLIQKDHCAQAWASEQIAIKAEMQVTGD